MTKTSGLLAALLAAPLSGHALDFSGYVRGGVAQPTQGGDSEACFQLPGALSKFRLGNECERYTELSLRDDLFVFQDGSVFSAEAMAALYSGYEQSPRFHGEDGWARMVQAYVHWSRVPALKGGAFWAGRRYYKRNDIHISDFYYWNQSATGAGIENVRIGELDYSYALSRKDNVFQGDYVNRHDFNIGTIPTNPDGGVGIGVSYIDDPGGEDTHSGWAVTVQHEQKVFLGGSNTFALQYGRGPGTGLGLTGDVNLDSSDRRWRVVEYFDWQQGRFGGQFQFVYQKDRREQGGDQDWLSVGVRPSYALSEQFKLVVELGHDQVDAEDGTRKLSKFTVAPTWSPAGPGFWTRPEVRLYYTYASWNRAAQEAANLVAAGTALSETGTFGSDRHGANLGAQVEYWW